MSKKRAKKNRRPTPSITPLSLLRPKLDELLGAQVSAPESHEVLLQQLDAAVEGLEADDFVPALLRSVRALGASAAGQLEGPLLEWLQARGGLEALARYAQRRGLESEQQQAALRWLEEAGVDTTGLQSVRGLRFDQAHAYGDESQGSLAVFCRDQRGHLGGVILLIDHNPPWEGAVKDVIALRPRADESRFRQFLEVARASGTPLLRKSEAEIKQEILEALEANRVEEIRLCRDLAASRELFLDCILPLQGTPETPPFTAEDFDELCRTGTPTEELRAQERTVGRRVRLADGKELLIMGTDDF
jgi:hypothetical protein